MGIHYSTYGNKQSSEYFFKQVHETITRLDIFTANILSMDKNIHRKHDNID